MYLRHASRSLRGPYDHAKQDVASKARISHSACPTYAMNSSPPDPKWHPPNGVKGGRRTVSRTQARRRLPERHLLSEGPRPTLDDYPYVTDTVRFLRRVH
jgi:hypothetical protein